MSYDLIIKWKLMDCRSLGENRSSHFGRHLENSHITVIVSEKLAAATHKHLLAKANGPFSKVQRTNTAKAILKARFM